MSHWWYLGIGLGVALLGNIPLMGLPGALLVGLIEIIITPLRIPVPELGDRAWPLMIACTFLWGLLLYPSYWLTRWFGWAEWTTWPLWLGLGLAVAAVLYFLNGK